jgi:hypothetical protein
MRYVFVSSMFVIRYGTAVVAQAQLLDDRASLLRQVLWCTPVI